MKARIYQPAKTAMQSGRNKTEDWVLEFVSDAKRQSDPLMGWTSVDSMVDQVRLTFETRAQAVAYAKREGMSFIVEEAKTRKRLVKSYSENFSAYRKQPWTH